MRTLPLLIIVSGVAVSIWAIFLSDRPFYTEQPSDNLPTCVNDWHVCRDNGDLVNHWSRIPDLRMMCEQTGKQRAKFGTPQFGEGGFLAPPSFASYKVGNNYPKDGAVTLVEQDAHFQNAYGAMARARAYCTYDLRTNKVSTFFLSPDEVSDLADPLYAGVDLREP